MDFFADKAKGLAAEARGTVGGALDRIEAELHQKKLELVAQAEAFKAEKLSMLKAFEEEKKAMVLRVFLDKFNGIFDYIMAMLLMVVKDLADDEYMPRCVKSMIDTILDAWWPDVKSEVRDAALAKINLHEPLAHGEPCCFGSPQAFIRYTILPYDRNVWRQIRNPLYLLLQLVSVFPVYSVAQIYYFIIFFIIDKSDQFQLEQFITIFKSLQFMSLGVLSALIGSVQYYVCTSRVPSTCDKDSPRVDIYTIIIFCLQVVFVWTAFFLTRCAKKKGGMFYQANKRTERDLRTRQERREGMVNAFRGEAIYTATATNEELDEEADRAARSRLMNLLIYDLFVFLLCIGLALWVTYDNQLDRHANVDTNDPNSSRGANSNWKYLTTLYWIKALYGLMGFPFLLLRLPGLSSLFSHARPTGYNIWGNTVPYLGEEEDGPVPWDPSRPYKDPEVQAEAEAVRQRRPDGL